VLLVDDDAAVLVAHEVEEGARVVRVVARVGQQRELAVQEHDGIAVAEEELCARGAAGAGGEVVDVAHRLGLEGHRGAARGDEHEAAAGVAVAGDELAGEGDGGGQVLGRRLVGEVVALGLLGVGHGWLCGGHAHALTAAWSREGRLRQGGACFTG
jgi:hypothetical protein